MQPPVIALWCVCRYARKTPIRIAGDPHTGVFDEPGNRLAMRHTMRLLRRHGLAIVTTRPARIAASKAVGRSFSTTHRGVDRDMTRPGNPVLSGLAEAPYVLVPLASAYDERIDELIAAAKLTPDLRWYSPDGPLARLAQRRRRMSRSRATSQMRTSFGAESGRCRRRMTKKREHDATSGV